MNAPRTSPVITSNLMRTPKNTKIKTVARQNADVQETQGTPITRKAPVLSPQYGCFPCQQRNIQQLQM